jgi:HTH-type transcriptional regulator/antitoxin HigA
LIKICSDSGVAVVIVKTPSGCRASGVTKFISPDRPLLLLSFRYLTDDQFWFTFFHEAAHLILHNDRSIFIEEINNSGLVSQQEAEANDFAAEELISHELRTQLAKIPLTKRSIVGFAIQAGISPGIVIGQLQHIGRVDHKRLNTFKRRYTWDSIL